MPSVAELAQQMNIDPATLPQELVTRLDSYYTEAQHNYELASRERAQTNEYITSYAGQTTRAATLEAENAGLRTTLEKLKEKGIEVTIPASAAGAPKNPESFDPNRFKTQVGDIVGQAIDASNAYLRLFGKPLPISIETLATEANARRMRPLDYAAEKYKFADKEAEQRTAEAKAHDDEISRKAIEKYQLEHPVTTGNPDLQRGRSSRSPQLPKAMDSKEVTEFANLPARERIKASIARSRQIVDERAAANA
jgi:hypothetical protein